MAWLPFYADSNDYTQIIERLNVDSEIAFIRPHGEGKWIAIQQVDKLDNGEYCLWHIPGGEITHYIDREKTIFSCSLRRLFNAPKKMTEASGTVRDPWKGWKGPRDSGWKEVPFLGNDPNIIRLTVNITGIQNRNAIGMSCFGWIGNRYKAVGNPAHKTTVNWWNRLRRWVKKQSVSKITRCGPIEHPQPEIWAFPSAYDKITAGEEREANAL